MTIFWVGPQFFQGDWAPFISLQVTCLLYHCLGVNLSLDIFQHEKNLIISLPSRASWSHNSQKTRFLLQNRVFGHVDHILGGPMHPLLIFQSYLNQFKSFTGFLYFNICENKENLIISFHTRGWVCSILNIKLGVCSMHSGKVKVGPHYIHTSQNRQFHIK